MSFRDTMNEVADQLRGLASLPEIDERPISVTLRKVTWAAGRVGADGGTTNEDLELLPRPRVREVSQQEIASSGGRYEAGDVRIGPITPEYPGGGYSPERLAPAITTNGVEVLYVLSGAIAGEYKRVALHTDRVHSYFLVVRRTRSTP